MPHCGCRTRSCTVCTFWKTSAWTYQIIFQQVKSPFVFCYCTDVFITGWWAADAGYLLTHCRTSVRGPVQGSAARAVSSRQLENKCDWYKIISKYILCWTPSEVNCANLGDNSVSRFSRWVRQVHNGLSANILMFSAKPCIFYWNNLSWFGHKD
jgi:hypothetical protein